MNRPLRLALLALGAGAFALAVHSDFPLCPLASSLGIPCPGCGLTRATLALVHGDVPTALHFHPLVLLLAPLVVALGLAFALELLRAPTSNPPRSSQLLLANGRRTTVVAAALLTLTLGVWLARFAGYLGGPVPVTSMRDWLSAQHASR